MGLQHVKALHEHVGAVAAVIVPVAAFVGLAAEFVKAVIGLVAGFAAVVIAIVAAGKQCELSTFWVCSSFGWACSTLGLQQLCKNGQCRFVAA